jgi:hypothetical protein
MYTYIPYPLPAVPKPENCPTTHWFKLQTSSYSSWEEEESGMRTGWLALYSPTLFFQSLYFLFSTTHHFVALQQLQQPPCIWVQQARWSQHSPQYLLAFCSKQGKNDRIWQIHTYSTRPHDSISFATFKVAVIVSLSNVNSISLFNFVFAPRHLYNFFLHMVTSLLENPSFDFDEVRD